MPKDSLPSPQVKPQENLPQSLLQKLLPRLKNLQKLVQSKLSQNLNPNQQQNQQPNLQNNSFESYTYKAADSNEAFFRFILGLTSLFLFLLLVNFFTNFLLDRQKGQLDTAFTALDNQSNLEDVYTDVSGRLVLYTKVSESRSFLKDKTRVVYDSVSPNVTLLELSVEESGFSLIAEGPDVLSFSHMLSDYINEDLIKSMILKSAHLNARTRTYVIEIEGIFL